MTNLGEPWDYMTVRGDMKCIISIFGAKKRNYRSDKTFTIQNPKAALQGMRIFWLEV